MRLSKWFSVKRLLNLVFILSISVLTAEAQLVVTNTNDDGAGSLRQAIIDANSTAAKSIIEFNIPGDGPHRIEPASRFQNIVNPIVIDGTSQPGWEVGNPMIIIDGSNVPIREQGLYLINEAHNSEIRGLVIGGYRPGDDGFNGFAIVAETNNNIFQGNFLGIDADGETAIPNSRGIQIMNASNNLIGGTTAEARNVISGNLAIGVAIFGNQIRPGPNSFDNKIIGNYFGTNAEGTAAVGNNDNIQVAEGAQNTIIGGLTPEERNIISGANFRGIVIAFEGTENTQIIGNFIGTDVTGTNAIPNTNRAINLLQGARNNIIGGTEEGARNIISGNASYAIAFQFSDASPGTVPVTNNVVVGNYIGVDVTGTTALPNNDGILFSGLSENNVIGGDTPAARNIISGNTRFGIQFTGINSKENLVIGNYIGTDPDGSSPIPNNSGIFFFTGANNNTIGGTAPSEGNLISGNSQGIVFNGASDNEIIGNFIGTDNNGTGALGNSFGISISNGSTNNIIGGADPARKNIISGNSSVGINISQATTQGNQILGNFIGIDVSGTESLPNGSNGIQLSGVSNTIHGNIISANSGTGISVLVGGDDNIITGNYIGTNTAGDTAMPNNTTGIWIRGDGNTIGGVTTADRNIISGNNQGGIRLFNFGTQVSDNVITGNFIGIAADGTTPLANNGSGILIDVGSDNIVGGDLSGSGNVISGNSQHGIQILNAASSGNRVEGNLIGTDYTGQEAVGNNISGISMTSSNTILKNNVISGNSLSGPTAGIDISGTTAINNLITGNKIGTNSTGDASLGNIGSGVRIRSPQNVIGGLEADDYNIISGNSQAGIFLFGNDANENSILGNYIGTNNAGSQTIGNGTHGIAIGGNANNQIGNGTSEGSNVIAYNNSDGIRIEVFGTEPTIGNSILQNSIHSNGLLGIDLAGNGITENDEDDSDTGPNNLQNFPEISSATYDDLTNSLLITFMVPSAPSNSEYPLIAEFFATNPDERQGKVFLGAGEFTEEDFSNGFKELSLTIAEGIELVAGDQITGTATDNGGNTSEFGALVTVEEPLSLPGVVTLISPEDASVDVSNTPTLIWDEADGADSYTIQLSTAGDFSSTVIDESGITATEFEAEALAWETTYFWRVRASNEAGDGEWSEVWSFTTEEEPLSAPDAVVLVSPEDGSVDVSIAPTLNWEAAATAETYRVQVSLSGDFSEPLIDQTLGNVTEYGFGDLDYETTYFWRVRASNEAGDGEWSEAWSFTTEEEPQAPPAIPVLVSPSLQEYNVPINTELIWEEAARAEYYRVQVSVDFDFSSLVADESGIVETSYALVELENQTTYVWRVKAFNDAGESDWSEMGLFGTESELITVTKVQTIDPAGSVLVDETNGIEVEFPEGAVSEPTDIISGSYTEFPPGVIISGALTFLGTEKFESINFSLPVHVTVDYDPGNIPDGAAEKNMRVLRYTELTETWEELDSEVDTETKKVRASTDRFSVFGVGIIEGTVYEPGTVALSSPEDGAADVSVSPLLSWQELQNTDTYTLQVSEGAEFSSTVVDQAGIDETSYQASGLELNSTYYWRVRGVNDAGPGDWSEVWSFTTGELSPPGTLTLSVTDNTPELSWEPSPSGSVSGYNIYRGDSPVALEQLTELNGSATGYTDGDVPQGGSFYAVTATGPGGSESGFTNVVSFFRVDLQAGSGWQLVSHAVSGAEPDVSGSLVYGYQRVYRGEQTLAEGRGYWIKDEQGAAYTLAGPGAAQLELELNAGWNLVGGPAGTFGADDIEDPSAILTTAPVYGYNGADYEPADEFTPGSGYWLYAETAGQVILSLDLTPAAASPGKILAATAAKVSTNTAAPEKDRLVVSSGGLSAELAMYGEPLTRDEKYRYLRPPLAPGQSLDVRTAEGYSAMDRASAEVVITAAAYPVTLRLETSLQGGSSYLLTGQQSAGADRQWPMGPGTEVVLTQAYERLMMQRATPGEEMVSQTVLEPGYPNPFNPSTNIRYRLAGQADVLLEVYDLGGRRIATLVNQSQQPGAYMVPFDGAGLASGIYFVRLQAGAYSSIQKLTLIK